MLARVGYGRPVDTPSVVAHFAAKHCRARVDFDISISTRMTMPTCAIPSRVLLVGLSRRSHGAEGARWNIEAKSCNRPHARRYHFLRMEQEVDGPRMTCQVSRATAPTMLSKKASSPPLALQRQPRVGRMNARTITRHAAEARRSADRAIRVSTPHMSLASVDFTAFRHDGQ